MLTITRSEGIAAVLSHPFVCLLIVAAYAAVALVIWLDRRPVRRPRPNTFLDPWTRAGREPGDLSGGKRP